MGFWTSILRGGLGIDAFTPNVTYVGANAEGLAEALGLDPSGMTPSEMFRTQPHLRTVVTFVARNIAQLGLHTFERVSDSDRRRDRTSPVSRALSAVDGTMTTYELVYALCVDFLLYDRAYWWVAPSSTVSSGWMIRRLPPSWVSTVKADAFSVGRYRVSLGDGVIELTADKVLAFSGYSPTSPRGGSSVIEALKTTLQEQIEASSYRSQVWKRGGRVSSVLERPATAPKWGDDARERFREDWYAKFTGRGAKAGGTPILEDGMTLRRIDFNAQEQQYVEAAKLSLTTVAAAYHVNPTLVGLLDNANYSNVREFRSMLYGDTLGPMIAQIEARLNTFLLPMLGMADDGSRYLEFNIGEKLQGNFEDQAKALQGSVGAPWMTRNEARGLQNLPSVDGGDELVTPLNVLIGGQSSPADGQTAGGGGPMASSSEDLQRLVAAAASLIRSGFAPAAALEAVGLDPTIEHLGLLPVTVQRPEAAENPDTEIEDALKSRLPRVKAVDRRPAETDHEKVIGAFFDRQGRVIKSRLNAKAADEWWDGERWDRELTAELYALMMTTTVKVGRDTLVGLGVDPDAYDVQRTVAYVEAMVAGIASGVNEATHQRIAAAVASDEDDALDTVLKQDRTSRAATMAVSLVTNGFSFGTVEAAQQQSPGATKTWRTTSSNPRKSHAAVDGETVPLDQKFSNGLMWPGASGADEDETAGCKCRLDVSIPEPEEGNP